MTSHEFARQLLAGPDLPIVTPRVLMHDDEEDSCSMVPRVDEEQGEDAEGNPKRVLVLGYSS